MNLAATVRILSLSLIGFILVGCSIEPPDPGVFYKQNNTAAAAKAGDILKSTPISGASKGAKAWRILYQSTGLKGEPIMVSGTVIAPDGKPPEGGRPVVAWAHPTTGVAQNCAPSLVKVLPLERTPGMRDFLKRGYVIAATDYPGLGSDGPHPYLVGASEGRAVLDSVRATANLAQAGASRTFAVWGHSQGGHAALFAGELAASYAPDLTLAGIAAAAPATDLATLYRHDLNSEQGKMLTSFALWSWHRVYGAPLDPLLSAPARKAVDAIAANCVEGPLEIARIDEIGETLDEGFLKADLTRVEPWKSLFAENTPGTRVSGVPVFIAQGAKDRVVRPQVTIDYAQKLCADGAPVQFEWRKGVGHILMGLAAAPAAAKWIAARFAGETAPNNCSILGAMTVSD